MKIAMGNDHAGVEMKNQIMAYLQQKGHEILNVGNDDPLDRQDDYPVYGEKAAKLVAGGQADCGILICGTGVGISLAANKVPGIRAAVCSEPYSAKLSKQHNNTNMLAFGARVIVSGTGVDVERLALAKELGADYTCNINERPLDDLVNELTGGYGVDVVLECSGNQYGINSALHNIKRRGHFVQIGMGKAEIPFYIEALNYREPIVTGSLGSRKASWEQALDLLARGKVKVDKIADVRMPLADWEKAFDMFRKKEGGKFILFPFEEDY